MKPSRFIHERELCDDIDNTLITKIYYAASDGIRFKELNL